MEMDAMLRFESEGAPLLPETERKGYIKTEGAKIWYSVHGEGFPVVLLHGGLGNSGNWGNQVDELMRHGFQTILIDSRGHGRSTNDGRAFSYRQLAADAAAVLDFLDIGRAVFVGWSDGADTALIFGDHYPERTAGVFFFACNMDSSGTKVFEMTPTIEACFNRHRTDYQQLSETPEDFDAFVEAVGEMQRTQPEYTKEELAQIHVPVLVVHSQFDEFIRLEHALYLTDSIPGAGFVLLEGVGHFAPIQNPALFNQELLQFLERIRVQEGQK